MLGKERPGTGQESGAGGGLLVVQDLGVGQSGVVVDGDMDVVIASAVAAVSGIGGAAVQPPAASVGDAAQLLTSTWTSSPGWSRS
jgi:hypothetical protein